MTSVASRILAGVLLALTGCHPTAKEKAVAQRWLQCEDCIRGELEALVMVGDAVTGILDDALKNGPPPSGREHVRRQSEDRYKGLQSPPFTLAQYVARYDSNYVAHYQSQASVGLSAIGTASARAALFRAMQRDSIYRYDVLRALATAPLALGATAGDTQAAPPDSMVRIKPTVRISDSVSGAPLPNIPVVFTIDSGGGQVSDSVRRSDSNGLASTQWSLGIVPDSYNVLRAEAFGHRFRFQATAHGNKPRLVFVVQPSNTQRGHPISPPVKVAVVDAWDRPDTTLTGTVEAMIVPGGVTVTGPADSGRVDLPPIIPTVAGTGFQIVARLTAATEAVSAPFNVAP